MGHLLGSTTGKMCSFLGFQRQANQTLWRLQVSWLSYSIQHYPCVYPPTHGQVAQWSAGSGKSFVARQLVAELQLGDGADGGYKPRSPCSDDSYKSIRGMSHFQTLSDLSVLQ